MTMNLIDILLLLAIAAAVFFAVRRIRRGSGCSCGGGCGGACDACMQKCSKRKQK